MARGRPAPASREDTAIVSELVNSPNGHIMNAVLDDGDSAEISVPVLNGKTLEVFRWGGYKIADGTAPSSLKVQVKDGTDTVDASANTVNTQSTDPASPVASVSNGSGSLSVFKMAVNNGTGSTIPDPGVGAVFGYRVK